MFGMLNGLSQLGRRHTPSPQGIQLQRIPGGGGHFEDDFPSNMGQFGCWNPFPFLRIDSNSRFRIGRIPIPSINRPNKVSPPREVSMPVVTPTLAIVLIFPLLFHFFTSHVPQHLPG